MATTNKSTARAQRWALQARHDGHEAIWLGRCTPATIVSAAIQEAVDAVWLDGAEEDKAALRGALDAAMLADLPIEAGPAESGHDDVQASTAE